MSIERFKVHIAIAFVLVACSSQGATAPQQTHKLVVEIETRGVDLDADGYLLIVSDAPALSLSTQDSVALDGLPSAASHVVSLTDLAPNCAVDGENPVEVRIPPGVLEGSATFGILCSFDAEITFTRWSEGGVPNHSVVSLHLPSLAVANHSLEGTMGSWSRDRNRIAYTRDTCESVYFRASCNVLGIAVVSGDRTGHMDVTAGNDTRPSWNPAGDELVFERYDGSSTRIYRVRVDGSMVETSVDIPADVLVAYNPSWSPDADRLAFSCYIDFSPSDLCTLDLQTGHWERLTYDTTEWHEQPEWSTDGTRIAFTVWRGFDRTIAVVNADGTNLTRLHSGHSPSWSPDGKRLVFVLEIDSPIRLDDGLWITNGDGSELFMLTDHGSDTEPAWRR